MADKMFLIITLRKEVQNREEGRAIYDTVKSRFEDKPDIGINGHVSNHFDLENGS